MNTAREQGEVLVMTFEEFSDANGIDVHDAEVQGHIHAGLRSFPNNKRLRRWYERETLRLGAKLLDNRQRARALYQEAIEQGLVRPPTRRERLERVAAGHEDNPSVLAARRILASMNADQSP